MTSELKNKPKNAISEKAATVKSEAMDSFRAGDSAAELNSTAGKKTRSKAVAVSSGKVSSTPKAKAGAAAGVKVKAKLKVKAGSVTEARAETAARPKARAGNAAAKVKSQPKAKAGIAVKAETISGLKVKSSKKVADSSSSVGKAGRLPEGLSGAKAAKAVVSSRAVAAHKSKASAGAAGKVKAARPVGRELAELVAAAAGEHKPINPVLLDLSALSSAADWFFIASADNPRQMSAIAEKIIRRARDRGVRALGHEGLGREEGHHWALVDLGDVVVHIFNLEARELYDLEGLWTDAPRCQVKV